MLDFLEFKLYSSWVVVEALSYFRGKFMQRRTYAWTRMSSKPKKNQPVSIISVRLSICVNVCWGVVQYSPPAFRIESSSNSWTNICVYVIVCMLFCACAGMYVCICVYAYIHRHMCVCKGAFYMCARAYVCVLAYLRRWE